MVVPETSPVRGHSGFPRDCCLHPRGLWQRRRLLQHDGHGHEQRAGEHLRRGAGSRRGQVEGHARRRRRRDLSAERVHRLGRATPSWAWTRISRRPSRAPSASRPRSSTRPSTASSPGLASGKYGLGMSSFTDTKEREKTVDFVTYFTAGTSFYVKAQGGPADQWARRPVREEGRGREGHDPGGRRRGAEQEVHRRGQAGRDAARLPRPERREPRHQQQPRRDRHGRLPRGRLPGRALQRPVQGRRASRTGRRPMGSRSRRTTGWPNRSSPA